LIPGARYIELATAQGHQAATAAAKDDAAAMDRAIARFLKSV
jgi:hypothetical protein